MLNATHVDAAEKVMQTGDKSTIGVGSARNFRLLPASPYDLKT